MSLLKPYGLTLLITFFLSYLLFRKRTRPLQLTSKDQELLLLFTLFGGIIGARLYHVLSEFNRYRNLGWNIFRIWSGGLGILGAWIGGGIAAWLYWKNKEKAFLTLLDAATPILLIAQGLGRTANLINQELLPYAVYEAGWVLFLAALILLSEKTFHINLGSGFCTGLFALGYGGGRFFLEMIRPPRLICGPLSLTRWLSLFMALLGFGLLINFFKQKPLSESQN